jgi:methylmalonyl-CoA/ethylmalonyl-CoA epimerase
MKEVGMAGEHSESPGGPKPFNGLVQIALGASNPAQTAAFYRDTLGLKVLFETGGMTFLEAAPGVRLMIGPAHGGAAKAEGAYLYFEPADWAETEAHLTREGVAFREASEILQRDGDRELALRFFEDPDGHALAMLGWRAAG